MVGKFRGNLVLCVSGVLLLLILHSSETKSDVLRWGITPKSPVQKKAEKTSEGGASPAKTSPQEKNETAGAISLSADGDVESEDSQTVPAAKTSQAIDTPLKKGSSEPTAAKKRPEEKTGQPSLGAAAKAIHWGNPLQKETCEGYLVSLRDLFLKTRHHSIQGAPCDTAENAAAFLRLSEQCAGECPPGFTHQSGYSDRILRNIRYLEKLGNDRCGVELPRRSPQYARGSTEDRR